MLASYFRGEKSQLDRYAYMAALYKLDEFFSGQFLDWAFSNRDWIRRTWNNTHILKSGFACVSDMMMKVYSTPTMGAVFESEDRIRIAFWVNPMSRNLTN